MDLGILFVSSYMMDAHWSPSQSTKLLVCSILILILPLTMSWPLPLGELACLLVRVSPILQERRCLTQLGTGLTKSLDVQYKTRLQDRWLITFNEDETYDMRDGDKVGRSAIGELL